MILEGKSDGDPVEVILRDKPLIFVVLLYVICMLAIVYAK
jgi:hypothetical protein